MRILQDGTVEIKNKSTGQTKIVQPQDLPNYGISYTKFADELNAFQHIGDPKVPQGSDAVSAVMKQGGSQFINQGKDKDTRIAIAQEILKSGGVGEYRKILPLTSLVDDKEAEALKTSTELLSKIDASRSQFNEDTPGGTGPLAQFIPQFLRSREGNSKVADVTDISSNYLNKISGKVVSDAESKRLNNFLPNKALTESENARRLDKLKNEIDTNNQLFEISKREGITINEAYKKYAQVDKGSNTLSIKKAPQQNNYGALNPVLNGQKTAKPSRFQIEAIE